MATKKAVEFTLSVESSFDDDVGMDEYRVKATTPKGKVIGSVNAHADCAVPSYAVVGTASVQKAYRGIGLYPQMLVELRDAVQRDGCLGIESPGANRTPDATASWRKFAAREPGVAIVRTDAEYGDDHTLSGLKRLERKLKRSK